MAFAHPGMMRRSGGESPPVETKFSFWGSLADLGRLVMRSGAPQLRLRIAAALALVFVGKAAGVIAPVMLGDAINTLQPVAQGGVAMGAAFILLVAAFAGLRLVAACAPFARDAIFTRVSQSTMAKAAVETFAHALGLSLDFHQSKQTGALSRVIDRGARSTDFLIRSLIFNLGPTAHRAGDGHGGDGRAAGPGLRRHRARPPWCSTSWSPSASPTGGCRTGAS